MNSGEIPFTNPFVGYDINWMEGSYYDAIMQQHIASEVNRETNPETLSANKNRNQMGVVDAETLSLLNEDELSEEAFFFFMPNLTDANREANAVSEEKTSKGKVAIIPIQGAMQKEFSSTFESSSTLNTIAQIRKAEKDPEIVAHVLKINSGGGRVNGTFELGRAIRGAKKPVIAACDDITCSAAYWVASQADEVYALSPTSIIGSIGVMTEHTDMSQYLERLGIKKTIITSSAGRLKKLGASTQPLSEDDRRSIEGRLNQTEKLFHKAIREGRGDRLEIDLSDERVSGVFTPSQAKREGLIDGRRSMSAINKKAARLANSQKAENKSDETSSDSKEDVKPSSQPIKDRFKMLSNLDKFLGKEEAKYEERQLTAEAHRKISEQLAAFDTLQVEYAELKAKSETLPSTEDFAALEEANAELKSQLETMSTENADYTAKFEELSTQFAALQQVFTDL